MSKTLYDVLQVSSKADHEIIEAAYLRLEAKLNAQDDEASLIQLKAVRLAYETLRNTERRTAYDQKLATTAIPPVHANAQQGYKSEVGDMASDWWESSRTKYISIGIFLVAAIGIYLMFIPKNKVADAAGETVKIERDRIRATTAIEERRVDNERTMIDRSMDNERVLIDRSMDNQGRGLEVRREHNLNSVEIARQAEERRMRDLENTAKARQDLIEMQRKQQEFDLQQRQNAERRHIEDRDRRLAQEQLERDRRDLRRLERENYGREITPR